MAVPDGDAQTQKIPSTFTRSRAKRGLKIDSTGDYEEFNTLGVFPHQKQDDSPTELKMNANSAFAQPEQDFDQYFTEMRKRNYQKGISVNNLGQRFLMSETQTNLDD
eukprot:CAMPEP_0170452200 /NCGR_PEP_ID=MMETSP0123-20130129/1182_1 /TAXON_ID=182087 /ORGANISM="Favella ehrenbergii, Strain Fehren 1" /LENGTH=106 /DNA_ID=CAMNT_0010714135 /DNA_START=235 /DNA_END=556 /DNA_ORIENTATION=-